MNIKAHRSTVWALAVALAGILSANGALLVYEPFAYPDGSLTGQGGALGTTGTWLSYESLHPANGWRVHQQGDYEANYAGWYIDDVTVTVH